MGLEDFIGLDSSTNSCTGSDKNELCSSITESNVIDSQQTASQLTEETVIEKYLGSNEGDVVHDHDQHVQEMEIDMDVAQSQPVLLDDVKSVETVISVETIDGVNSRAVSENGHGTVRNDNDISKYNMHNTSVSGVKRARITYVDQEPSVHVVYNSLTRASKRKLEELLQQWSEWHAQQKFSSNDSNKTLESGEETFFPALHVDVKKASTVSFWMDNQTTKEQNKFIPLDGDSVPLYDRGFVLGLSSADELTNLQGGVETLESSRCFNCGSYSHSLKDCSKPRDNVAVNNARQQHKSKRGLAPGPRNPTRYYQNSPGGKYDGLRPGFLGSETRQLLGLGELDPPPWLNRMRELGYPPGYLVPDDEDQPSGITIYADEKTEEDQEDGEIRETNNPEPQKKMSIKFPGINAPIPENADERRWASLPESSSFDSSGKRFYSTSNHFSEDSMRSQYGDSRRSRVHRDDGPPGCNRTDDFSASHFIPRYSSNDGSYRNEFTSPRGNSVPKSPSLGRSQSDRGRWSPLVHEGSPSHSPYSSYPSPIWSHDNHHRSSSDYSSHRKGRTDHHHYRK